MAPIKFATIGIGRKGPDHIQSMLAFPDKFQLAGVCDTAPDRLENLPAAWGNPRKFASLDEVLKDPSIEFVTIATRHMDHTPMAIQILESGRYAGIEKPLATSVREMEQLLKVAERHPGKLFLLHNRRWEPAFVKARELINSGVLGDVNYIKLYRSVGYCRRNDWMTMPEFYGGLLTNWGPHLIDQALQFLDSPVANLWADVRHCISIGDGDDMFKIILTGKNHRVADVEVTGANAMPGREMEIICSHGTIVYDGGARLHARLLDPAISLKDLKPHPGNPPRQYGNFDETLSFIDADYDLPKVGLEQMWLRIYDSIRSGAPYPITFEQGLAVVKVTEEAFRFSGFAPMQKFLK